MSDTTTMADRLPIENIELTESESIVDSKVSPFPSDIANGDGGGKSAIIVDRLRLKNIKLAGFKSFVDPTTVPFPSNLVGVVGPNGCGKSNIIDAVRWVMGESSAKNLRAEQGTDVIFNGSTERKPAGQASVELTFDNPHGAIGGEYAQYSEISIKRVINRDGQSTYLLNNGRCRRKDITDIFQGTGLGARSYTIIEQGMISKLIEAKPEDLRIYLEEAAGISKYKERRRETETRIRHTRENLDRIKDILEELDNQLARLKRQSEAAAKYKELKQEERTYKGQLLALKHQSLAEQIHALEQMIQSFSIQLEAEIAKQHSADSEIEKIREHHHDARNAFQEVQEKFYGVGGQIARIEQSISHQQERKAQLQVDLQAAEESYAYAKSHVDEDQQQVIRLGELLTELSPELAVLKEKAESAQENLHFAEESMQQWQIEWDDLNQVSAKASEQAQVSQTQIQHLEQRMTSAKHRIEKLSEEHERLLGQLQAYDTQMLQATVQEVGDAEQEQQAHLANLRVDIQSAKEKARTSSEQIAELRVALQKLHGRQASLEALQQAALGKNNDKITQWLSANQLQTQQRLAQTLDVDAGWDVAVETVLGNYLQAVCIDDIHSVANLIGSITEGEITFIASNAAMQTTSANYPRLADKVKSRSGAKQLLENIFIADDLAQAFSRVDTLTGAESIITPEGIWLGRGWLKVAKDKDQTQGVLKREQELNELAQQLDEKQRQLDEAQAVLAAAQAQVDEKEQALLDVQASLGQVTQQLANLRTELKVKESKQEQVKQRIAQLLQEREEAHSTISEANESLLGIRQTWQAAMQIMEEHADRRQAMQDKRDSTKEQLDAARMIHREMKDQFHDLNVKVSTTQADYDNKRQNIQRMSAQVEQSALRCETLRESLLQSDAPMQDFAAELEVLLERKLTISQELSEKRAEMENYDEQMRMHEQARHAAEREAEGLRNQIQDLKMRWQEQQVRSNTIKEQLQEIEETIENLVATMPETASIDEWEQQLTSIANRISRLGAINLAAIDEYDVEAERKMYLDKQHQDLTEALATLEAAIEKIDKETRAKFKETYEIVNQHFQHLFPKVFGGGSAYLELTGEDLLDAGVSVMARPPGKKNSTIHLLSGGEKALTAIALVFSIFQLNPAPFCMLDEVDAPLDDANVGRYCNLIKEMSKQVQFIFISHNKVAMEMAEQLTGVTMKEPGVSRMVAVDIEQAMAMADA